MIDIISAALSLFAIVVSIYAAFTANKSAAAAIRSSNCGVIFDDYLIKKIPQAERRLGLMIKAFYAMETISVMPWLT